jgi:hypothetical protein
LETKNLAEHNKQLTLGREYKIAMEKCKIKFPHPTKLNMELEYISSRQPDNTHHVKYLHSLQE